jgi:nitronate monooxygenase
MEGLAPESQGGFLAEIVVRLRRVLPTEGSAHRLFAHARDMPARTKQRECTAQAAEKGLGLTPARLVLPRLEQYRMALRTRLSKLLDLEHPIISAPMAFAAGGQLAAAVTAAGGLGLIGGGYGDAEWLEKEFAAAGNARIGCGFITWSLANRPKLLDLVLSRAPAAVMLSFGSPLPFAAAIKRSGARLICQVQCMQHAREAVDAGADIIVAQGAEAGGHGRSRATLTLVPEVADYLAKAAPATVLVAAGGIADGRGLAAALMLGADGALIGSRFWASSEAQVNPAFQARAVAVDGDATIRTTVVDLARKLAWPPQFTARVVKNRFVEDWHGRESELARAGVAEREGQRYMAAMQAGDPDNTGVWGRRGRRLDQGCAPRARSSERDCWRCRAPAAQASAQPRHVTSARAAPRSR